ncbi:uncharacterized protein LOC111377073 [Olea europaea var. sylvestris]|uniref:uncharacterized protein LOC111377073 n=1 Tax=Olea europaea var. sylvestris TaxID=158386 RepID=UPI000C1D7195|nr:uncharacterized protein LOC111377073 [Olea europaea var. sylvestris]
MVLGLSGALTFAKGSIKLKVELGSAPRQVKTNSEFVVFNTPSPYDDVMGQPVLFSLRAAVSLYHYSVKFPTSYGVGEVKGNRELAERYLRTKIQWEEPIEELEGVQVCADDPSKELKVGYELQSSTRNEIVAFLRQNLDVFAWNHGDMRVIDPKIACHKLQVDPSVRLKQQKRRPLNPGRYESLNKGVQKLLHNGFLHEAKYPKWIANPVLVKKYNGDWRVGIDFTDLNNACPKDSFPLLRIDQMVDATARHELLASWTRTPDITR